MHSRKEYEGELTAGDFIDEVDDAQREISAYSQFSLIERKNRELQKIDYLINRIENEEDFGLCEECGTPIPRERLLIVPETTLCVACQRELEKMDQRKSMASRVSSAMGPNRREVIWEKRRTGWKRMTMPLSSTTSATYPVWMWKKRNPAGRQRREIVELRLTTETQRGNSCHNLSHDPFPMTWGKARIHILLDLRQPQHIDRNFLFVGISRQTKTFLCVLRASVVNFMSRGERRGRDSCPCGG
jgi:RNA polymerase-binding protein DksA